MKKRIFTLGLFLAMLISTPLAQAQQQKKKSQFIGTWQAHVQGQDFLLIVSEKNGKLAINFTDLKGQDIGVYGYGANEEDGKLSLLMDTMEYGEIPMTLTIDPKDKDKANGDVAGGSVWMDAVRKK